jgi:hypothetical protein
MPINFPTGATPSQIYSYNGLNWIYTGTYWKVYPQLTDILPLTGGTFNKNTETLTLSNVINSSISVSGFSDYYVTGGTYDSNTGIITFSNTSGGSFNISGFTSGGGTFTGGTVSGETNFTNGLTANTISATTYQNLPTDIRVTGGTFSSETITFTNNTGGTFSVSGISQTPIYQKSVWTSFQTSTRSVSSTNFGSGSGIAVPFYVNKSVTILNSKIECTGISTNPTNCEFGIYDVITGTVSNRLFHQVFQVSGTGLYTFTTNLTLQPGIYAYALTQDIILGWRSFTVSNNGLCVDSNIGDNVFISGKSKASNNTPNPYGTQSNYNSNMPLAIFEIQI